MTETALAKELLMAEVRKERGQFVTQRIIDRLRIFHAPAFDGAVLTALAAEVNRELALEAGGAP